MSLLGGCHLRGVPCRCAFITPSALGPRTLRPTPLLRNFVRPTLTASSSPAIIGQIYPPFKNRKWQNQDQPPWRPSPAWRPSRAPPALLLAPKRTRCQRGRISGASLGTYSGGVHQHQGFLPFSTPAKMIFSWGEEYDLPSTSLRLAWERLTEAHRAVRQAFKVYIICKQRGFRMELGPALQQWTHY